MTTLKVGVAGAGVFGNYHAQKAAASARTELVGVYDIDLERATRIASQFGAKGFDNYEAFLDACDAIVIAVRLSGMKSWRGRPLRRTAMCSSRNRWR